MRDITHTFTFKSEVLFFKLYFQIGQAMLRQGRPCTKLRDSSQHYKFLELVNATAANTTTDNPN